ncbi:response regulator [Paenibacillus sp. GCM10012303]|uniref:response regulator n=1 Tax=Paenibacillus sp. GCM10012303 TaxID=3317340 RepID=UPI0036080C3B
MTYRVVVIDDKAIIRKALIQTMDWNNLSCEVVGQADNGFEGKKLIEQLRPDILITDIKLPGPSGLDLAEHMHQVSPSSKTILMTGFQQFEYAQRAVKLGVMDFMLKPIRNEELAQIVRKAVTVLQSAQTRRHEEEKLATMYRELEHQIHDSIPFLRSKLLADLLTGEVAGEQARDAMARLELRDGRLQLLGMRPRRLDRTLQAAQRSKLLNHLYAQVTQKAQQSKEKYGIDLAEARSKEDLIIALLLPKGASEREMRRIVTAFAGGLCGRDESWQAFDFVTAVTAPYRGIGETAAAFEQLQAMLDAGFFGAGGKLLFPESIPGAKDKAERFSIIRDLEQFHHMLGQAAVQPLTEPIDRFVERVRMYSEGSIRVAKGLIAEACLAIARHYYRVTGNEFGLDRSIDKMLDDIERLPDLAQASSYLHRLMEEIRIKLSGRRKEYSLQVRHILDYINSHFSGNLTLTSVADHCGLNPSYVSRLLRSETGDTFVDLVAKARIEVAKRLLRDPKYKVGEVGEMVGYKEYAYFYQVFKKFEGTSPRAFQNRT